MPQGTRHTLTGTLRRVTFGYALETDDGGVWRLDLGWRQAWRARCHLDRRVVVEGVRSGFAVLDVRRLRTPID